MNISFPIAKSLVPQPAPNFYDQTLTPTVRENVATYASVKHRKKIPPIEKHRIEIIFYHAQALKAEFDERWICADFFWQELKDALVKPTETFGGYFTFENNLTVNDFVEKVIAPFHAGFYNHYITCEDKEHIKRADFHIRCIKYYTNQPGFKSFNDGIMVPYLKKQLTNYSAQKKWKEVIDTGEELVAMGEHDRIVQDQLINGYLFQVVLLLKQDTKILTRHADNSVTLGRELTKLEGLKKRFPYSTLFIDGIGELYHQYSLALGQSGQLPEALAANYQAVAHKPGLQYAMEFRRQLNEAINVAQMDAEINRSYGRKQLTPEGERMRKQAMIGSSMAQKLIDSGELERIKIFRETAVAAEIWLAMGLPQTEKWQERAVSALPIWNIIHSKCFTLNETLEMLAKHLDPNEYPFDKIAAHWFGNKDKDLGSEKLAVYQPLLKTAKNIGVKQDPPFRLWLNSKQDLWIKVRMAAAIASILVLIAVYSLESFRTSNRDSAYKSILDGLKSNNYKQIIENAESFMSNRSLVSSDGREPLVEQHYDQALVKYLLEQRRQITAND